MNIHPKVLHRMYSIYGRNVAAHGRSRARTMFIEAFGLSHYLQMQGSKEAKALPSDETKAQPRSERSRADKANVNSDSVERAKAAAHARRELRIAKGSNHAANED